MGGFAYYIDQDTEDWNEKDEVLCASVLSLKLNMYLD